MDPLRQLEDKIECTLPPVTNYEWSVISWSSGGGEFTRFYGDYVLGDSYNLGDAK